MFNLDIRQLNHPTPSSRSIDQKDDSTKRLATKEKSRESVALQNTSYPQEKGPLFPGIKRDATLPENGSEDIAFHQSFLHKKERKTHQPLLNYSQRLGYKPEEYSQFEKDLMNASHGLMIKILNDVQEMRMEEQVELLEAFKKLGDKLHVLRSKKTKTLDDLAENAKLEDYWSSIRNYANIATIGTGGAVGITKMMLGYFSQDNDLFNQGVIATLGAIGSGSAMLMEKWGVNSSATNLLSGVSTAAAAYGSWQIEHPQIFNFHEDSLFGMIHQPFVQFIQDKMPLFQSLFKTGTVFVNSLSKFQLNKVNVVGYTIQAETNNLEFHDKKFKSKLSKSLNGLKMTEFINEMKGAAELVAKENKMKKEISRICASAA